MSTLHYLEYVVVSAVAEDQMLISAVMMLSDGHHFMVSTFTVSSLLCLETYSM